MLLLNVNAVLERDRAIEGDVTSTTTKVLEECDDAKTPYAILSHRWQKEVDHNEMMNLVEMEKAKPKEVSQKNGYKKILGACKQAVKDDLEWLWVDTCCIDKRSSSELSEAINSMYRWYENSTKCYAYLYDVDDRIFPTEPNLERFDKYKGWPEWFSRGWTLQELIAPKDIQFFNKEWAPIGNKRDLADTLEKITRISKDILISGLDSGVRSAAQIMSWAADRETARVEDRAYSLLGLFGVHMPMVYGEGKSAFQRLQLEIIRSSNDHSIFAWDPKGRVRRCGSILADDPNYFRDCDGIWSVEPEWFVQRFKSHIRDHVARHVVPTKSRMQSAVLIMRKRPHIKELSTCSIASGGLQVSLPVAPYPGSSPLFRVTLGCVASLVGPLMTIDLMSDSTHYYRFFGATGEPTKLPRVEQLFLSCDQGESRRSLRLDDRTVSFYGFKRCSTFPHSIVGNSVKLSLMNDLIVVIYTNKAGVRFALGLGHYLGSAWTHTICDESRSQTCMSWESCDGCRSQTSTSREGCNECRSRTCMSCESYAKEAHDSMWSRQADLALACNNKKSDHGDTTHTNPDTASFIKHAHLPRSIWAARTTWGVWYRGNCTVTIDILVCTGCCRGPLALETSTADWSGIETPGLMRQAVNPSSHIYALYMDGTKTHLLHFTGIEDVQLGDYGHCDPTFKCDGNIFQDLAAPDPAYDPIKRCISTGNDRTVAANIMTVRASGDSSSRLLLRQPEGLSLPNNRQLVLLLKSLSCHLTDKCLVTSVVRCTARNGHSRTKLCYLSKPQVWRRDTIKGERRAQFREIRERFYNLLNLFHSATSGGNSRSPNSKVTKEAIKYFSAMFGIEHLENYVGKITFFKNLSAGLELNPEPPRVTQDPSINALVKTLRKRMDHIMPRRRMQGVQREITAISDTLGVKLLEGMAAIYTQAYHVLRQLKANMDRSCMEYDMSKPITEFTSSLLPQTTALKNDNIHDMVQEIKRLQAILDTTENIDEQCALEEDITGRILWTCHSGLRPAVEYVPDRVLHSILENDKMCNLVDRVKFLEEISQVFNDALAKLPTDDQAHLRRIMADAEAGTSKYRLLLDERAREQRVPGTMREEQTRT